MYIKLKNKSHSGLEMNPVVWAGVLILVMILLSFGVVNAMQAYNSHLENKTKYFLEEFFDNLTINSIAGEGIMTDDRNKRNIYLFENGTNTINVYSYKEIFEQATPTSIATPVIKFDRFYTLSLDQISSELTFLYEPKSVLDSNGVMKVGLQVDAPDGELKIFSADNGFVEMDAADKLLPSSNDDRIKLNQGSYQGRFSIDKFHRGDVVNDKQYGRLLTSCIAPGCTEYTNIKIYVQYKRDIIGYVEMNSQNNKLKFIYDKQSVPDNYNIANYCTNANGTCHPNFEYDATNACTYAYGMCNPDGKPDINHSNQQSCTWSAGSCN